MVGPSGLHMHNAFATTWNGLVEPLQRNCATSTRSAKQEKREERAIRASAAVDARLQRERGLSWRCLLTNSQQTKLKRVFARRWNSITKRRNHNEEVSRTCNHVCYGAFDDGRGAEQ